MRNIAITQEILLLISELDEFKGTWKALNTLAPDRLAALRKIATIESIGSSTRIEGARLSDREVKDLIANLGQQSLISRDEQEVAGYAEVMDLVFSSWESIPFTENYIKQIHTILLKYSSKDERHRGEYKKFPNNVQAFDVDGKSLGVVFETASPFDTPQQMSEIVTWTAEQFVSREIHLLLAIGVFVVAFLAIHPFQDGNGRLSRILTVLLLLKAGYAYVPYSSLESIIEENKDRYYLALRKTQGTLNQDEPDWEPWLLFFLRALQRQKVRLQTKLESERIMASTLPTLSVRILELAKEHGRVTTQGIEKATGESRSTIKARLKQLTEDRLLVRYGKGRSTWYGLS
ncbi:Fic family protein [Pseudanabaena sp. PCC 6802]|uniref:Fic family protein n=1 Tax=Pseudanabaena sp. PCC 6802 TaxID=118173 RepID=UPI000347A28E|nr:Fic family protein [Pseudanabaena sp. PCC 6802]